MWHWPTMHGAAAWTPSRAVLLARARTRCLSMCQQATAPARSGRRTLQHVAATAQTSSSSSSSGSCIPECTSPAADLEWAGLSDWRSRGIDAGRGWGEGGPVDSIAAPGALEAAALPLSSSLVSCGLAVLQTADPTHKAALTHRAWSAYCRGTLPLGLAASAAQPPDRPARPQLPILVTPKQVPSPRDSPLPLPAHLLHNLAHIELNAIDLAWDTVVRFAPLNLPAAFYEDFARVADDESRHFGWCLQRLGELGHSYGDMPAHDLLWEGAQRSAFDLSARLAIVPMSQEARGLDAGMRLSERLVGAGDRRSAAIVARIAQEERAHVAVGVTWFMGVCSALGVSDPAASFRSWLTQLGPDLLKGPFNHSARQEVGLGREWYDVSCWPLEAAARIVPPAKAAAARGRGEPVPQLVAQQGIAGDNQITTGPPEAQQQRQQQQQQCAESVASGSELLLQQLRARLEQHLEVEAAAAP